MEYKGIFDNYGVKSVSSNDITKAAYLLNSEQNVAVRAAGYIPSNGGGPQSDIVHFIVLSDEGPRTLAGSFYLALRARKGRKPEPRVGREALQWMNENDEVLIGNIGTDVYIGKLGSLYLAELVHVVSEATSEGDLRKKALKAKKRPTKKTRTVTEFVRDLFVVAAALKRADGRCEVPGCKHVLFERETGPDYLEVHHIVPLGEGGEDTLLNVAAICPACHRQHHFGTDRLARRKKLLKRIAKLEASK